LSDEATPPRKEAAAVCWKCRDGEVQFLLVRTSGGDRWTFPKGGIEAGESSARAAEEEAGEEAGARGTVDEELLDTYVPSSEEEAEPVRAHLLNVEEQGQPRKKERGFRHPEWFSAEKAIEALAEKRDERYAQEHRRLIEAALGRLEPC
jgi:8-oxo-dGTP pyrophosphatase MutT (NUDIX family)